MRRVTYGPSERIDTALGSLFPFFLAGAAGVAIARRRLLPSYLAIGAGTFFSFMLLCPHLPGRTGLGKVLWLEAPLAGALLWSELFGGMRPTLRAELLVAMISLLVWGSELGGLAPHMKSELDPLLARLGIDRIGNAAFAGTVRADLLNRRRLLTYDRPRCNGCRRCFELCPLGLWEMDGSKRAVLARPDDCTACGACLSQCPTAAITAPTGAAATSAAR